MLFIFTWKYSNMYIISIMLDIANTVTTVDFHDCININNGLAYGWIMSEQSKDVFAPHVTWINHLNEIKLPYYN